MKEIICTLNKDGVFEPVFDTDNMREQGKRIIRNALGLSVEEFDNLSMERFSYLLNNFNIP